MTMEVSIQLQHLDDALLKPISTQFPDPLLPAEQALLRAYIVLCHAIFEEAIEDLALSHLNRVRGWLEDGVVPHSAARLAFALSSLVHPDTVGLDIPLKVLASKAHPLLVGLIQQNHGIRQSNVKKLVQAVGIEWSKLDASLNAELLDLDTLGSKRGEAGHLSPFTEKSVQITSLVYPDEAREWVMAAHLAVIALEDYCLALIRDQRPSLIVDWDGN